jgi:hypothetical protein
MQNGIAVLLSGGTDPPQLAGHDEPLRSLARPIAIGVPLLQVVGIAVALRRIRRWRRHPPPERGTTGWQLRHLALPLIADIGVPAALWWAYFDTAGLSPLDYLRLLPTSPDLMLSLAVAAILGVGWGAVRTWLSRRVAAGRQTTRPAVEVP